MPSPGSGIYVWEGPIPLPPSTVTTGQAHQRATTGAAATLHSLAPIPLRATNPPIAVTLQVEAASGAVPVFFTTDGLTVPTAALGLQIPVAPAFIRIPAADALKAGTGIQLFSAAPSNVQVFYEWDRPSL